MWAEELPRPILHAIASGALLLLPVVAAAQDQAEIEARLDRLKSEIEQIQQRLDDDLGERDALMQAVAEAERQVSSARRAVRETADDMESSRAQIEALDTRIQALENDSARQSSELGRQLAMAYRHGTGSRLKMLLNQDDPRILSRHLAYHGYLTRARLEVMDRLQATVAQLAENRALLESERQALALLLERREDELQQLELAQAERGRALAGLEGRIQDDRERLADLRSDAEELANLLEQLAEALADVPPEVELVDFVELRGQLPRPVDGALARRFGDSRGGDLQWNGWLIRAETGTPVKAIAHGRVAYAEWLRGYGLLLILDHGDGFMSLYAHNEALLRDVGDWVAPGETIATAGASGGSDQVGVYFELRRNGQPMDPTGWMAAR